MRKLRSLRNSMQTPPTSSLPPTPRLFCSWGTLKTLGAFGTAGSATLKKCCAISLLRRLARKYKPLISTSSSPIITARCFESIGSTHYDGPDVASIREKVDSVKENVKAVLAVIQLMLDGNEATRIKELELAEQKRMMKELQEAEQKSSMIRSLH
jgi:hypothetical protein